MIVIIGRALYWLLCAMTAPRPPVPDLPPVLPSEPPRLDPLTTDHTPPPGVHVVDVLNRPLARYYTGVLDLDEATERTVREARELAPVGTDHSGEPTTTPACWACGSPLGFHAEHVPCWKVPPFKLTSPMLPDGSTYRRTT